MSDVGMRPGIDEDDKKQRQLLARALAYILSPQWGKQSDELEGHMTSKEIEIAQ